MSKDGGPAFPWGEHGTHLGGMTLRDYFAAKAMQAGIDRLAGEGALFDEQGCTYSSVATQAYLIADAMLGRRTET